MPIFRRYYVLAQIGFIWIRKVAADEKPLKLGWMEFERFSFRVHID
jgi:hypothetical protein